MKLISLFSIIILFVFLGCAKSNQHEDHSQEEVDTDNPNQALYNQVMDIHDEVMPKMDDLYRLKKDLQDKITSTPDLPEEVKKALELRIAHLDSVSNLMMDWMHQFDPLPDSAEQEEAREYLETEMEKIKKVKDAMLEAIEKEKGS